MNITYLHIKTSPFPSAGGVGLPVTEGSGWFPQILHLVSSSVRQRRMYRERLWLLHFQQSPLDTRSSRRALEVTPAPCTLHPPPSTVHLTPLNHPIAPTQLLPTQSLNHSITQQPSSDFRARTLHLAALNPSVLKLPISPGLRKRRRLKILNKYPLKNSSVRVAAVI